ncbi:TPA: CdiA family toxin C-terminal domain-containing protein [Pseudomonas aeruginosa]
MNIRFLHMIVLGIGYKAQPFTKTVYDPKVISDQKVLDLGRQAAASGYVKAVASGDRYCDSTAGGITFRVYLDERTGAVLNFYPK